MNPATRFDRTRWLGSSAWPAVVLLVAANLVPLAGVLFFRWDVRTILVMYWLENGIVGMLNVVRILSAQEPDRSGQASTAAKAGLAAFFTVHYGIFWVVHGVFVMVLTNRGGLLGGFQTPLDVVTADPQILLGALALLVSHLASLLLNFFGRGEYRRVSPASQMFLPYARVFVLHLTIVLGGFVVIGLGQPAALVALLVLFKTVFDLGLHLLERRRYRATAVAV
jgi:hypothetical protein